MKTELIREIKCGCKIVFHQETPGMGNDHRSKCFDIEYCPACKLAREMKDMLKRILTLIPDECLEKVEANKLIKQAEAKCICDQRYSIDNKRLCPVHFPEKAKGE